MRKITVEVPNAFAARLDEIETALVKANQKFRRDTEAFEAAHADWVTAGSDPATEPTPPSPPPPVVPAPEILSALLRVQSVRDAMRGALSDLAAFARDARAARLTERAARLREEAQRAEDEAAALA